MQKISLVLLFSVIFCAFGKELYGMKRGNASSLAHNRPQKKASLLTLNNFKEAIEKGNLAFIKAYLEANPNLENKKIKLEANYGNQLVTPLMAAILLKQEDIALYFVEQGANITTSINRIPPLVEAAWQGQKKLVRLMLERGAQVNYSGVSKEKGSALSGAAYTGDIEMATLLLAKGAHIHVYNDHPLRCAASGGQLKMVQFLIQQGADIHVLCKAQDNDSPLAAAVRSGHKDVVAFLISQARHTGNDYTNAFKIALHTNDSEIISLFLQEDSIIDKDKSLLHALHCERFKVVEILLEKGALNKASQDVQYEYLKWVAGHVNRPHCLEPYTKNFLAKRYKESFLKKALSITRQDVTLARYLVDNGALQAEENKQELVVPAVTYGAGCLLERLHTSGELAVYSQEILKEALTVAALRGDIAAAKILLETKLQLTLEEKASLVGKAAHQGNESLVEYFLSLGWDVNGHVVEEIGLSQGNPIKQEQCPMLKAISRSFHCTANESLKMVKLLLAKGARARNTAEMKDWLYYAMKNYSPEIVTCLLSLYPNALVCLPDIKEELQQEEDYSFSLKYTKLVEIKHIIYHYRMAGVSFVNFNEAFLRDAMANETLLQLHPTHGYTVLMLAALFSNSKFIEWFLTNFPITAEYINQKDKFGHSAVEYALICGNIEIACTLIKTYISKKGTEPLYLGRFGGVEGLKHAIEWRNLALINQLLDLGAQPTLELVKYAREKGCLAIMVRLAAKLINPTGTETSNTSYLIALASAFKT
jgi:ankyrin repeat protein